MLFGQKSWASLINHNITKILNNPRQTFKNYQNFTSIKPP